MRKHFIKRIDNVGALTIGLSRDLIQRECFSAAASQLERDIDMLEGQLESLVDLWKELREYSQNLETFRKEEIGDVKIS